MNHLSDNFVDKHRSWPETVVQITDASAIAALTLVETMKQPRLLLSRWKTPESVL